MNKEQDEKIRIDVELDIEQIQDGIRYNGHIIIVGTQLDFEVEFANPISQLDNIERFESFAEARKIYKITLKRGNEVIELTDEENDVFMVLIIMNVIAFHDSQFTRNCQEGLMGKFLRNEGTVRELGALPSLVYQVTRSYYFSLKLVKALSAPKFGCKFST